MTNTALRSPERRICSLFRHPPFCTEEATLVNARRPVIEEVKVAGKTKYRLVSKEGHKNLGTYNTRSQAQQRERQVEFFKNQGKGGGNASGSGSK